MNAIGISARGHHYFVPKENMHRIDLLEEFMGAIAQENLYVYANPHRDVKYISINSMYVADDESSAVK